MAPGTTPRAFLAVLSLLVVPWTVVFSGGDVGTVFAWGLFDPGTLHVTTLSAYLFEHTRGLPERLLAWPAAVVVCAAAVASAAAGLAIGREDPRLTAGLLVLAGASQLVFALGIGRARGVVAVPTGTVLAWVVAWWFYWPLVRPAWSR